LELAKRARGTPRKGNRILKRIRDFAQIRGEGVVDTKILKKACQVLEIDKMGLDKMDRAYLMALCLDHHGGPVGVENLAATLSEDTGTIEEMVEPYLMQQGLIKRTRKGRVATKKCFKHLGIPITKKTQERLF
jgi:Holliday junction DNA helicase RuvB